jgi:hypothetical protein
MNVVLTNQAWACEEKLTVLQSGTHDFFLNILQHS